MKPVLTEITANVESGKTQMYMAEWLVHKLFISALGVWILAIFCVTGEKSAVRYQIESANRDGFMGEGVMGGWIGGGGMRTHSPSQIGYSGARGCQCPYQPDTWTMPEEVFHCYL
jgi:hypothetical protein